MVFFSPKLFSGVLAVSKEENVILQVIRTALINLREHCIKTFVLNPRYLISEKMHPNLTLPQSIAKDKQSQTGGGVLNFHLGRGVQPKSRKWGLVVRIGPGTKFGGLLNWSFFFFFLTNKLLSELIFGPNEMRLKWNLLNWVLANF